MRNTKYHFITVCVWLNYYGNVCSIQRRTYYVPACSTLYNLLNF